MLQAGFITQAVQKVASFDAIISSFINAMAFMEEVEDIKKHCIKFLIVFYDMGGPFILAGNTIKKCIQETANNQLKLQLNLDTAK